MCCLLKKCENYRGLPLSMQPAAEPVESTLITADSSEQKTRTPLWLGVTGCATIRYSTLPVPAAPAAQSLNSNTYPDFLPLFRALSISSRSDSEQVYPAAG